MTTKMKVIFQCSTSEGHRTKLLAIHPVKKWVGIINQNNTFSLWNYQEKILIKCFSCNTLDDTPTNSKNPQSNQIKQIVFFDKYSLCSQNDTNTMKNNIIFLTPTKLFFYDYITDVIKQLAEKQFEQKNIKKVCVYTQDKICVAISDGSFKVIDCKDIYNKNAISVRTIKGYHNKPINWIFAYAQNYNEMPKVITASAQDGTMACWNIDMILRSNNSQQQFMTPCFKFTSNQKLKNKDGNINQELLALQHDSSSYRLVTLSNQWIRLWSTMTGMQVRRLKNHGSKFANILFFSHFSYPPQSFITHSRSSRLFIIRNSNNTIELNDQIDLRPLFPGSSSHSNEPLAISKIKSSLYHPSHLFIITNYNLAVLELDKFYMPPFGTSQLFLTQLSTLNSKQFITNKAEQQIRKDIKANQISNIKFKEDILLNTFYLSVDHEWVYFNLVEIQYNSMLSENRKFKLFRLSDMSPLTLMQGGRSVININFDGSQIIIFNKTLEFYEIYQAHNPFSNIGTYEDLLNKVEKDERIDFYYKFRQLGSGYCREIAWHQYKNQFAIIAGLDDHNKFIEVKVSKEKKGIFKSKQGELRVERSGTPTKFCLCIYHYYDGEYRKIHQTDPILSRSLRIYNFGSFYGYSVAKGNLDIVEFINGDKNSSKQIEGMLNAPQNVYVSYCESCYILSYDKFFIIYHIQENGSIVYLRTLEFTILNGYFWEKLFFFLTESSLYFLHIINKETILIKVADVSNYSTIKTPIEIICFQDDDFEPQLQILPSGHLQIAGLINLNIMLLNENSNVTLVSLQKFPYIVFCLQVATQSIDKGNALIQRASANIRKYMKQTVYNYGLVMHLPSE